MDYKILGEEILPYCVWGMTLYRVSHKIVSTFVLLNSRPLKHLEVPSWKSIRSPFRVDFKTIKYVIIW